MRPACFALIVGLMTLVSACGDSVYVDNPDVSPTPTTGDDDTAPVDLDHDGVSVAQGDCDDSNVKVYPGADEKCDDLDNDCDGQADNTSSSGAPPVDARTWYVDLDADGHGDPAVSIPTCAAPEGYVASKDDCDDSNPKVFPGATEVCNGIDDDCDEHVDDDDPTVTGQLTFFLDSDEDSYGVSADSRLACVADGAYSASQGGDCDDANASIHPGAAETCDGIDQDCNGAIDDNTSFATWYKDADGDTYGDPAISTSVCVQPAGYVSSNTDCDDTLATVNPGVTEICNGLDDDCDGQTDESLMATFYPDVDGDGYGAAAGSLQACTMPTGYVTNATDCDDAQVSVHPGANESCDGLDNNCDGLIDEGAKTTYYADADGDGYGNPAMSQQACTKPTGYVTSATDCDDARASVHPDAGESCDGLDNDCDGLIDEGVKVSYYADTDSDGYGSPTTSTQACSKPTGYVTNATDCDDTRAAVHPGATETCDGLDNNCDGGIDEGLKTTYYVDADADGYGSPAGSTQACSRPTGYVTNGTDCDDTRAAVHPGATETCDGLDNNCDGGIDEGLKTTYYVDADADGYGSPLGSTQACSKPTGYVANSTDCDDSRAAVHPGATEVCDSLDNNCDGATDEGVKTVYYADADADGYGNPAQTTAACSKPAGYVTDKTDCDDTRASVHPNATETCNGVDDNCNAQIDEGVITTYYLDADGDSYGTPSTSAQGCSAPSGKYVTNSKDCNDSDPAIHPGVTEVCNGVDDNCNGQPDEGVSSTFYPDSDADTYGGSTGSISGCSAPAGYVQNNTDCDDKSATVYPGAKEYCNGVDEDCDGIIDNVAATFAADDPESLIDDEADLVEGSACAGTLLLTEVAVLGEVQEFIEIYNPTSKTVDLTNYYLTDLSNTVSSKPDNQFIKVVNGNATSDINDFLVRFPAGASIAPYSFKVIAIHKADSTGAEQALDPAIKPDWEIADTSATIPNMTVAGGATIDKKNVGLSNTSEFLLLFYWDGSSSLVKDVDYFRWQTGTTPVGVDRTGVSITGPSGSATYLADTAIALQPATASSHSGGGSYCRRDYTEGSEKQVGGNGLFGADETSENTGPGSTATWGLCTKFTPGTF